MDILRLIDYAAVLALMTVFIVTPVGVSAIAWGRHKGGWFATGSAPARAAVKTTIFCVDTALLAGAWCMVRCVIAG